MNAALTLAPMSAGVAKAWHALQREMLNETHGLEVVPPGSVVLPPPKANFFFRPRHDQMGFVLRLGDAHSCDEYTTYLQMPKGWEHFWNPAHWHLNMRRTDASGEAWTRAGGKYVVDDFGFLAEVAA